MLKKIGSSAFVQRLAGGLLSGYLKLVWATARVEIDPRLYHYTEANWPVIVTLWHGQHFLLPFLRKPNYNFAVLISKSRDGEINAVAAENLGVIAIRGSGAQGRKISEKGGARAFLKMKSALDKGQSMAVTADVPKISRLVGEGVILLAQKTGRPLVPLAIATSRRLVMNSWDKAHVTLPFSKVYVAVSEKIWIIPFDANAQMLEEYRIDLQEEMQRITQRAENCVMKKTAS
jgi:lysophospholipid acyltransferase (LPLAT)-like uncharacterized protein